MKFLINIARFIVGVLFIFSGLVKANDPLGLSYKMLEFFQVWGWNFLNDFTLAFAVLIIAFEIIAGIAVLLGWKMKMFSWLLLLLIIFFTFLTAYAVFSGKIRTCGCFGDCIPLTAEQSFGKDLVLLALIFFIFVFRKRIQPLFKPAISGILLILTTLFSFGFQGYVLKHLPIVDCLPYKAGKNLLKQRMVPEGAIQDSSVITFVYEKQGKQMEFNSQNFPPDFDDSLYHFVKRYDKLIRKGNADPSIRDFVLTSVSGNDSTKEILGQKGYALLLFIRDDLNIQDQRENAQLNQLLSYSKNKHVPFYLIANSHRVMDQLGTIIKDAALLPSATFMCDGVAIETAARANPTIYLLKDGTVLNKWANSDFAKAYLEMQTQF